LYRDKAWYRRMLPYMKHLPLPEEFIPGRGDGLVSERSSRLPWPSKHYVLRENHFSIICDGAAGFIIEFINLDVQVFL
ncbi:MAG: hypothetical protein D6828_04400, partial [Nitrospirae bacterium]